MFLASEVSFIAGGEDGGHAREHGDLSEDRGGAGDEVTRSTVEGLSGEDQVVAGGGVDGHPARGSCRRWRKRLKEQGHTGLLDCRRGTTEPPAGAEGAEPKGFLSLYRDKYFDLNVRHFHEKLGREIIRIGLGVYTWVKQALQRRRSGPESLSQARRAPQAT